MCEIRTWKTKSVPRVIYQRYSDLLYLCCTDAVPVISKNNVWSLWTATTNTWPTTRPREDPAEGQRTNLPYRRQIPASGRQISFILILLFNMRNNSMCNTATRLLSAGFHCGFASSSGDMFFRKAAFPVCSSRHGTWGKNVFSLQALLYWIIGKRAWQLFTGFPLLAFFFS